MAPARKHTLTHRCIRRLKSDRKMRKPLVEKKRRARINDSLHELRVLMVDTELQSKMENAEVLEMTVRRVESILQNRIQEIHQEASERFAAGYIQCMHDVHTFVLGYPEMDPKVGAELLNHLLESMPLHGQECLQTTQSDKDPCRRPQSPPLASLVSPATSSCVSADEFISDLDDTDWERSQVSSCEESEQSQGSSSEESELRDGSLGYGTPTSVWRPW
ncbi:transcription cofactor HES-6-like isoform X1 [Stigmatopora nigra]